MPILSRDFRHPRVDLRGLRLIQITCTLLFVGALLWPIAWVFLHHYTLTGQYEESVGYRYFFSLRKVYDSPVSLFTPQGQSINIIQALIQVGLTKFGIPISEVQPRIDYFCYASVVIFQLLNAVCFFWMILRVTRPDAVVLSTVFWLVLFYSPDLPIRYSLLEPDYHTVECCFALIAAGSVLRTHQGAQLSKMGNVLFGVFFGLAAATKITLVLFPAVAYAFAIFQFHDRKKILAWIVHAGFVAGLCWLFILLADSSWRLDILFQNEKKFASFMLAGSDNIVKQDRLWPIWIFDRVTTSPVYLSLIYLTPVFALLTVICSRIKEHFVFSIPIFCISLAENYLLYRRDYAASWVEAAFLLQLVLYGSFVVFFVPLLAKMRHRLLSGLAALASVALIFQLLFSVRSGVLPIISFVRQNTEDQKPLAAAQARISGSRLWLVPQNDVRPLSIDSAIMKGGWGRFWLDPDSPTLRAMFPNRDYRFFTYQKVQDLTAYQAVLFVSSGDLASDVVKLSELYSIGLSNWRCNILLPLSGQKIALCTPK